LSPATSRHWELESHAATTS
jgi:hypothetical protein